MNICSMDINRKHTSQNVYHNMPFSSFCFFPHQFLVLRLLALFLHFVSQLSCSSGSPCVRHLFASFLLHTLIFCSTARLFLLFDKNYVQSNMVENHVVLPPLTTGIYQIQYCICQFSFAPFAFSNFSILLSPISYFVLTGPSSANIIFKFDIFLDLYIIPCKFLTKEDAYENRSFGTAKRRQKRAF